MRKGQGLSGSGHWHNQGLSASAGYQQDLLLYCGEGKVRGDRVRGQRRCDRGVPQGRPGRGRRGLAAAVPEGQHYKTDQEFAEVCFVPAGHSRRRARFLAIREPLRQLDLGDAGQLAFPTEEFAASFKLFGIVTNRTLPGDLVAARTLRQERGGPCGHEAGRMPRGLFGANAAWLMILAHNLNAVMKRLVLGPAWGA
jgi:hypothetical protein